MPVIQTIEPLDLSYHQLYLPFVSDEERQELRARESQRVLEYKLTVYDDDYELGEEASGLAYQAYNDALAIAEQISGIDALYGKQGDDDFDPWAEILIDVEVDRWRISVTSMIDCGQVRLLIMTDQSERITIECPNYLELSFEPRGEAHAMEVSIDAKRFGGWPELAMRMRALKEALESTENVR